MPRAKGLFRAKVSTIKNGAHLHFEARTIGKERIAKGLGNRFDPLPFFPYIKQP